MKNEKLLMCKQLLNEIALLHCPDGTNVQAVIDQWLYAIATDSDLYSNFEINKKIHLKNDLLEILKTAGYYKNQKQFYSSLFDNCILKPSESPKFKFIDLFAGIGGMRLGFQNAGGLCVFSSEFEKNAQATYLENHGELPFGDITKIPEECIPDHDVLIAGFPCQPFSHAGLKLGIEDTRGTLFHDIARILSCKKPKFALLENVKGLISHDKGKTLQVILRTLLSIGYSCIIPKEIIESGTPKQLQAYAKQMVLKSCDFGVPQNRQRIYIVLWLNNLNLEFKYPEPLGLKTTVGQILEKDVHSKFYLSDKLWEGHQRRKQNNQINGKGFGYGLVNAESSFTNTISARYYKDGSEILIDELNGKNPRKLTQREAARLQGFPDSFKINKSNVQAYKQFGNSVSVPVISQISSKIANLI